MLDIRISGKINKVRPQPHVAIGETTAQGQVTHEANIHFPEAPIEWV